MASTKDIPSYCPDPIMPVFTYNWDSFCPPAQPQMKWIPVNQTTAVTNTGTTTATNTGNTTATTTPTTTNTATTVPNTSTNPTIAAAPAAEPSICHHGGVHYWNPNPSCIW